MSQKLFCGMQPLFFFPSHSLQSSIQQGKNLITLSPSIVSPADTRNDKLNYCKIGIAQYLCNSMQILPGAIEVLCSADGKENGLWECQKNWPLKHCSLNKTKPNAYLNIWGRRGFTLEQSCSNIRYLHSVQLPSHCGLGKQYSSPILPPPPKTSTQISLSLASYKDPSMNEGLCESREDNTHSLPVRGN